MINFSQQTNILDYFLSLAILHLYSDLHFKFVTEKISAADA